MVTYILFYFWTLFMNLFRRGRVVHFLSFGLIAILLFGLRYEVGGDWGAYLGYFKSFEHDRPIAFEPAFHWLNRFLYWLTGNFQSLIFVCFLFTYLIYHKSIYSYTDQVNISFIVWLGVNLLSFGLLRSNIATAIFFYSLRYVQQRKFKKYFFCMVFATLFHYSAILLFFVYPVLKRKYSTTELLIGLSISSCFLFVNLFSYMGEVLSVLPLIGGKIAGYLSYTDHYYNKPLGLGVRFYEAFGLLVLVLLKRKTLQKKYPSYFQLFLNLLVMYLCIYLFFNSVTVFAVRYIKYFELAHIVLFSYLFVLFKKGASRKIYLIAVILYFGLRYFITLSGVLSQQNNAAFFLPYKNYLIEQL